MKRELSGGFEGTKSPSGQVRVDEVMPAKTVALVQVQALDWSHDCLLRVLCLHLHAFQVPKGSFLRMRGLDAYYVDVKRQVELKV